MDVGFIQENIPLYIEAAGLTARIALIGIILSILIGFICCIVRSIKKYSTAGAVILSLFWIATGWHCVKFRGMCHYRSCISGRQLHGRGVPLRYGGGAKDPDGVSDEPWHETDADFYKDPASTGSGDIHPGFLCECHISDQRDFRIFSGSTCGSGLCRKRPDRNFVSDRRSTAYARDRISGVTASDIHYLFIHRKEGALCRIRA